jgi:hypothetical protein
VSERCKEQIRLLRQILEKYPTIKIVVLTGYFSFLEGGFKYKNVEGMRVASDAPTPDDSAAFRAAATSMIRSLLAEGKKVVVLRDIPDLVFNPRSCVTYGNIIMALLRGMGTNRTGSNCGIPLEEFEARNKIYDLSLSSILAEFPEVLEVNPRSLFCRGGFCRAIDGDVFLYWNSDHLTIHGANMVVSKFSDIIVKFSK